VVLIASNEAHGQQHENGKLYAASTIYKFSSCVALDVDV